MGGDDHSNENSIDIDLGAYGYGVADDYLSDLEISSIDIDSLDPYYDMSTYTIGAGGGAAGHTLSVAGGGGGVSTSSYWNTGTTISNGGSFGDSNVLLDNSGVHIKEGADLTIGDRSLGEFMRKMEDRLAILVPDPAKLEKFEALKKAYDHYKLMEKLCQENDKESK